MLDAFVVIGYFLPLAIGIALLGHVSYESKVAKMISLAVMFFFALEYMLVGGFPEFPAFMMFYLAGYLVTSKGAV